MEQGLTRRNLLTGTLVAGAGLALVAIGCNKNKELACADNPELTAAEQSARTTLGYTDKAPNADKHCANCNFFKPAGPDSCGGCQILKGKVSPNGYCNSWAAKV